MWYLFLQIWGWLLAAFVLGWFAHWIYIRRPAGQSPKKADPAKASD